MSPDAAPLTTACDREHLRLLTDKLSEKTGDLSHQRDDCEHSSISGWNSSFLERSSVHQSASITTAQRHIRHLYTLWTPTSHRARRFHCEKRRTPSGSLVAPAQGGEPSLPEVLLVDDDRAFVETLAMLLRLEGYTVTAAFSVDAAVRYLGASTPDVLISDIEIGRSNGWELVRYANRYNPDLHVVVVTGDADLFAAKWEYFYTPVFLKPFDPNQLLDHLRQHVR
jgi:CheY-like chemotaxis protein